MAMTLRSPHASAAPRRIFAAATKNGELELLIYDSIGESFWGGGVTAESIKQKLDEAGDVSKISVRINSPGGDVFEGSAIYSLLSQHKAPVECYVDGVAASAAFTIAMAGKTIHISESATMMCHDAWGGCVGKALDMRAMADDLDTISITMRDIYSRRSGMAAEEVQKVMDKEALLNAAQCVAYGFADDVIQLNRKDEEEAKALAASYDLSKFKNARKNSHSSAENLAEDPDPDEGDDCPCSCAKCKAGDCAACDNTDCDDPNCDHEDEESKALAAAEVKREEDNVAVLEI